MVVEAIKPNYNILRINSSTLLTEGVYCRSARCGCLRNRWRHWGSFDGVGPRPCSLVGGAFCCTGCARRFRQMCRIGSFSVFCFLLPLPKRCARERHAFASCSPAPTASYRRLPSGDAPSLRCAVLMSAPPRTPLGGRSSVRSPSHMADSKRLPSCARHRLSASGWRRLVEDRLSRRVELCEGGVCIGVVGRRITPCRIAPFDPRHRFAGDRARALICFFRASPSAVNSHALAGC